MPSYNYIINKAKSRTLDKNQNYMCIVVGPTGSSKSYSALSLAMLIDPTFDISRVAFKAKKFLELSSEGLDPGSVIVFDEAGIDVSSREWYTVRNKAINQTVETFRRDNLVCIWTTPVMKNIDKKSRSYFHGLAVMLEPDRAGWGACKYFDLVPDVEEGGVLKFYPTVSDERNRPIKLEGKSPSYPNMNLPDPRNIKAKDGTPKGERVIEAYEEKKKQFTEEIKRKGIEELEEEQKDDSFDLHPDEIIGHLSRNYSEFGLGDPDLSNAQLARRAYARLKAREPDADFTKADIRNVIGYIRDNPEEAKKSTEDPFKEKKEGEIEVDESLIPTVRKMRKNGMSLREIADRLNISWYEFYIENYREWESRGLVEPTD